MAQNRKVYAFLAVFLLLSATPLDASRVLHGHEVAGRIHARVGGGDSDSSKDSETAKWLFTASCETLEQRFKRRIEETRTKVKSGELGFAGQSSLLLKTWSTVRTLRRATSKDCEWATQQNFDTGALAGLTNETLATNPCLGDAQAMLREAESVEEPQERSQAFFSAMQVLLTPPGEACRTVSEEEMSDGDDVEDVDSMEEELLSDPDAAVDLLEEDADEMANTLAEAVLQTADGSEGSFLQFGQDPSTLPVAPGGTIQSAIGGAVEVVLAPVGQVAQNVYTFAAGQYPVHPGAAATTAEYLTYGIGVVAWLMIFTLACTVALHIVMLVLGVILCMLRWFFNILILRPHVGTLPVCMFKWTRHVQGSRIFRLGAAATCAGFGAAPLLTPLMAR